MRKYILYLYTDQDKISHKYLTFAWNDPVSVNSIGLYMAVKCYNTFATPVLTTRFNVVDSEHRVITRADCIQFVVVVPQF